MVNSITAWLAQFFDEVEPMDFYRAVFPQGCLDTAGAFTPGKYTGIIVAVTNEKWKSGKYKVKRYTVTDDLEAVQTVLQTDDFCVCSPISYAGKKRESAAARELYGIAVDVDHIRMRDGIPQGLIDLWEGHIKTVERIPKPTYIVSSGTGIHLYYLLDTPLEMRQNTVIELQAMKRELTRLLWNEGIVDILDDRDIQYEPIFQGFRMPGTITKKGDRARAFETGSRVSINYLNEFMDNGSKVTFQKKKRKRNGLTLEQAKAAFPEWYEKRIVNGEERNYWCVNRSVYDWWRERIRTEARVGHRYFCLYCLAVYARKCSHYHPEKNPNPVTESELEKDAFEIGAQFDGMSKRKEDCFTNADILDSLEGWQVDSAEQFTRQLISYRAGIEIQPNKRNYRKQETHLKIARYIQTLAFDETGAAWDAKNGHQSKEAVVKEWQQLHPEGRKVDCIRETGLSKSTVYKHWSKGE